MYASHRMLFAMVVISGVVAFGAIYKEGIPADCLGATDAAKTP